MPPKLAIRPATSQIDFATNAQTQTCMILRKLPAEIRVTIWKHVAEDVELTWERRWSQSHQLQRKGGEYKDGKPKAPGIILACKEMHQEAMPILYAKANFVFMTRTAMDNWLKLISDENFRLVQRVEKCSRRYWVNGPMLHVTKELGRRSSSRANGSKKKQAT